MPIIGEAFIAIRPLITGFGAATKVGVDKELAGQDLFGGIRTQGGKATKVVEDDFAATGKNIGKSMESGTSKISSLFDHLGSTAGNWGLPFASSLGKVGDSIDKVDGKGKKLQGTLSTIGGLSLAAGGAIAVGIGAESVHLAAGLAESDGQIASHENISVKAAANIGKAFESSAGKTVFSANQQSAAFAPVAGELDQISGHALTAGQSLKFMSDTGDLAEATGGQLGSTTSAVASIMQGFQIPVSGSTKLVNQLFNTARITGVGVDSLGSTIDRLKARLGVAAPTVGDLSSLLVDLNEHGVQGARGLLVVNTAVNTLLQSVPKVDAASAKAANTLSTKLGSANTTVANATTALATAQANAATKVQNAQTALADEQDRVAASSTAGAHTTAQQMALQNAATRVTQAQASASASVAAAQTRLSQAQGKLTADQANGAASTNAQVLAMQQLGLQVYDSSGKFVGMRDVIAQLQPKLEGMTQQQQLATLTQVFGASASKSLLATVLAGPAAYDKAAASVNKSSTAHKGAAEQNQNFMRQLDILKASLIDDGDKIGTALIPKLEDLAKWTEHDVEWFTKHKTVAEGLALVIGGVLTLAVGAFAINTGAKFVKFLQSAGDSMGKLATTISNKSTLIQSSNKKVSDSTQTTAGKVSGSEEEIGGAAGGAAESVQGASTTIEGALDKLSGQIEILSGAISGNIAKAGASFTVMDEGSTEAESIVKRAMAGMVETVEADSGLIIAANARAGASFGTYAAGSEEAALAAKTSGLSDLRAAPAAALEADAVPAAEVAGGGLAKGLLTGVAGKAVGGLIAVQMYDAFAEKPLGKVIGKDAASTLGDAGTGAAIGFAVGGPLGAAAGGALGVAFAQRTKIANFLGISGDLAEIKKNNAEIALDKKEDKRNNAIIAKSKTVTGQTAVQGTQANSDQQKIALLTSLQGAVHTAATTSGTNSQAYKQALSNLYTTERTWLPNLKNVSTAGVESKITTLQGKLVAAQAAQKFIGGAGALAPAQALLAAQKAQLKVDQTGGASESTLKYQQGLINQTNTHIKDLKSVAGKITKDTTAITNAQALKTAMDHTNTTITQLKNQIATTPPPKQKMTGKVKATMSGGK